MKKFFWLLLMFSIFFINYSKAMSDDDLVKYFNEKIFNIKSDDDFMESFYQKFRNIPDDKKSLVLTTKIKSDKDERNLLYKIVNFKSHLDLPSLHQFIDKYIKIVNPKDIEDCLYSITDVTNCLVTTLDVFLKKLEQAKKNELIITKKNWWDNVCNQMKANIKYSYNKITIIDCNKTDSFFSFLNMFLEHLQNNDEKDNLILQTIKDDATGSTYLAEYGPLVYATLFYKKNETNKSILSYIEKLMKSLSSDDKRVEALKMKVNNISNIIGIEGNIYPSLIFCAIDKRTFPKFIKTILKSIEDKNKRDSFILTSIYDEQFNGNKDTYHFSPLSYAAVQGHENFEPLLKILSSDEMRKNGCLENKVITMNGKESLNQIQALFHIGSQSSFNSTDLAKVLNYILILNNVYVDCNNFPLNALLDLLKSALLHKNNKSLNKDKTGHDDCRYCTWSEKNSLDKEMESCAQFLIVFLKRLPTKDLANWLINNRALYLICIADPEYLSLNLVINYQDRFKYYFKNNIHYEIIELLKKISKEQRLEFFENELNFFESNYEYNQFIILIMLLDIFNQETKEEILINKEMISYSINLFSNNWLIELLQYLSKEKQKKLFKDLGLDENKINATTILSFAEKFSDRYPLKKNSDDIKKTSVGKDFGIESQIVALKQSLEQLRKKLQSLKNGLDQIASKLKSDAKLAT